ncbi:hypothetical protein KBI52_06640 [Microvirga sp. HBU67558]|nr:MULTISPECIES: hypothetical protein [unclassified Microvirga]MBQ0819894.1 hypothetical protein [Microvirga sp. HBU67558]
MIGNPPPPVSHSGYPSLMEASAAIERPFRALAVLKGQIARSLALIPVCHFEPQIPFRPRERLSAYPGGMSKKMNRAVPKKGIPRPRYNNSPRWGSKNNTRFLAAQPHGSVTAWINRLFPKNGF